MRVVSQYIYTKLNAGPKAKVDVERILRENFKCDVCTIKMKRDIESQYDIFISRIKKIMFKIYNFKKEDILIVQLPFAKTMLVDNGDKVLVGFIHDIEGLRTFNQDVLDRELAYYKKFDYLVVHNDKMKKFLQENGIKNKIIVLEMFDYIVTGEGEKSSNYNTENKYIVYAGNLNPEKAPFLYSLSEDKLEFDFNIYGVELSDDINNRIHYKGKYSPDELPLKLEGDLGLVWDGQIDDSDEDEPAKNYTKYNNPHKLSCYLAAGLPVIVWEKAAIADFVKKYNLGYTIRSIYDINNLDFIELTEKEKNVIEISKKIKTGYFTKRAFNEILEDVSK